MQKIACLLLLSFYLVSCGGDSNKANQSTSSHENEVLNELNQQLKENPKNASLYFKRGKLYHQLEMDSLALIDFQSAVDLDSMKAEYYSAIGDLLFEHKDVSGSIKWIQRAVFLNPDDEVAHLKMGKLFMFTEDYPKAFAEINTVLRTNVYNAEAYFLKGMCYKGMKDTAKAISSFQTAVQTEPRYVDAHMQLALLYEAKKDPIALKYFENAYKADSSDLEPLYGQGMFWQNQQKFSEAKKVFQRIINIDPSYPKSYYNMGWMLLQEDSTEKASRQFTIAIQQKPDYFQAYYNRGLCSEILGDFIKAKEDYNQALSFNPDYEDCKKALARVSSKN
jgi:tetratricopeptide (TPR) repeat protein